MTKLIIFSALIIFILCIGNSCVSKFSTKLNDIDSVIRIVNPDHCCNCNSNNKTMNLLNTKDGKLNTYFWKAVLIRNQNDFDPIQKANKTKAELIKLMPELANYKRIYLEFNEMQFGKTDTATGYKIFGTSYLIKNKCNGFVRGISAKELIKKSHHKKFETALCTK